MLSMVEHTFLGPFLDFQWPEESDFPYARYFWGQVTNEEVQWLHRVQNPSLKVFFKFC